MYITEKTVMMTHLENSGFTVCSVTTTKRILLRVLWLTSASPHAVWCWRADRHTLILFWARTRPSLRWWESPDVTRVLLSSAGGELLPGYESDRCPAAHVHERGGRLLGPVAAADESETRHARWDVTQNSAEFLLVRSDRFPAFWFGLLKFEVWSSLLSRPFKGFFVPGFPKLQRFQVHHDQIISKLIPKLKKHLVRSQLRKCCIRQNECEAAALQDDM